MSGGPASMPGMPSPVIWEEVETHCWKICRRSFGLVRPGRRLISWGSPLLDEVSRGLHQIHRSQQSASSSVCSTYTSPCEGLKPLNNKEVQGPDYVG